MYLMRSELQTSMKGKAHSFLSWERDSKEEGWWRRQRWADIQATTFAGLGRFSASIPAISPATDRLPLLLLEVVDH